MKAPALYGTHKGCRYEAYTHKGYCYETYIHKGRRYETYIHRDPLQNLRRA